VHGGFEGMQVSARYGFPDEGCRGGAIHSFQRATVSTALHCVPCAQPPRSWALVIERLEALLAVVDLKRSGKQSKCPKAGWLFTFPALPLRYAAFENPVMNLSADWRLLSGRAWGAVLFCFCQL